MAGSPAPAQPAPASAEGRSNSGASTVDGVGPEAMGPYTFERRLGVGGMGEVHLARHRLLDRRVAIKHIRLDMDSGLEGRKRLRREARAAARLSHPAVVQIHDLLESEDGDWIVMEYVDGPTLGELLARRGPLGVERALDLGRQIALGLAEAHEHGVLHRDLKSDNIILEGARLQDDAERRDGRRTRDRAGATNPIEDEPWRARILDFGLAKVLWWHAEAETSSYASSLTAHGEVMGTCRAMSPEQAKGLALDGRSDLFSLGSLLYEMLTAVAPFQAESPVATMTRVVAHEPAPVHHLAPGIPTEVSHAIGRLMRKAADDRPTDGWQVARELDRLLDQHNPRRLRAAAFAGPGPARRLDTAPGQSAGDSELPAGRPEPGNPRRRRDEDGTRRSASRAVRGFRVVRTPTFWLSILAALVLGWIGASWLGSANHSARPAETPAQMGAQASARTGSQTAPPTKERAEGVASAQGPAPVGPSVQAAELRRAATLLWARGQADAARANLQLAAELLRRGQDDAELADVLADLALARWPRDPAEAPVVGSLLDEALRAARRSGDGLARIRLDSLLAEHHRRSGDLERARSQALAVLERVRLLEQAPSPEKVPGTLPPEKVPGTLPPENEASSTTGQGSAPPPDLALAYLVLADCDAALGRPGPAASWLDRADRVLGPRPGQLAASTGAMPAEPGRRDQVRLRLADAFELAGRPLDANALRQL